MVSVILRKNRDDYNSLAGKLCSGQSYRSIVTLILLSVGECDGARSVRRARTMNLSGAGPT
jgi:hypothetical protein